MNEQLLPTQYGILLYLERNSSPETRALARLAECNIGSDVQSSSSEYTVLPYLEYTV